MAYKVFVKEPMKVVVVKSILRKKEVRSWSNDAKGEFKVLIENLIDIYGVQGFLSGKAKKPFQDGLIEIKKKYNLK